MPGKRVVGVLLSTLTLFALSVVIVAFMFRREERALQGPPKPPTELRSPKVGIVEQRLFTLSRRGLALRNEQLERLNGYGWVDREKGIIHIPIDRAIDQMVEESRP